MKELEKLLGRIIQRINVNLRELEYDVSPFIKNLVPLNQMVKFHAFYGITPNHPLDFLFKHSNLAGSYFLGKIQVRNSILYKSDIRGDELKSKGDVFHYPKFEIPITTDEGIDIEDSFLIKTLVHNFSHDPETLEKFFIRDTISSHYANIHGAPMDGSFLGPFSTVDLTTMRDCVIGAFSYIQASEVDHLNIEPGTVWVRSPDEFNFHYRYPPRTVSRTIFVLAKVSHPKVCSSILWRDRKEDFGQLFNVFNIEQPASVPESSSLNRFSVIKPKTYISENVMVAQRAYLENAWLGKGANAQEQCYVINSRLEGFDIMAHGAKIIETNLGENVFVGFNSFLRGQTDSPAYRRPGHHHHAPYHHRYRKNHWPYRPAIWFGG